MKDEIKEILDFKEDADYKKLSCDEIAILKDYITNLQEENKNCTRKHWQQKCAEHCANEMIYKSRNEKAIEYTKQFINGKTSRIDEWKNVELVLETIVQLLQGEDKDDRLE